MPNPTLSIIMPVHNGEKYLAESIESILSSTYTDFELIVINDRSVDDTPKIVQACSAQDTRVHLIDNKNAPGIAGALNTGLSIAKGTYIARADADDINTASRFETQIQYLTQHPSITIVGGYYQSFGEGIRETIHKHPKHPYTIAWRFISNTYFCHPSVMFKASVLQTIAAYPEVASEDFAFFSEIVHHFQGANIPQVLIQYRQHNTNYSNTDRSPIEKSVRATYEKNYEFYTGSMMHADIFFAFHAQRDLSIKNIFTILSKSWRIAQKIHHAYQKNIVHLIHLFFVIKIDIIKAVILHYARALRRTLQ